MEQYIWPLSGITSTSLIYGCMEIAGSWDDSPITQEQKKKGFAALDAARSAGINFYDHADIYCRGKSEELFGDWLKAHPGLRDAITLQSKCGIQFPEEVPGKRKLPVRFNFSYDHIMSSVEGILSRLGTEYLDILLLHRPDPLVEPEEVAAAFSELHKSGKVRHFGVSNHSPAQIELLLAYLDQPIITNQLEISLLHPDLVSEGTAVNQREPGYVTRDHGTMEYCRETGITVQAWSPMARGLLSGADTTGRLENVRNAARLVAELAEEKGVSREAIVLAWLLRHPAPILPVLGTTNPERIAAAAEAPEVELSREEWYLLLEEARGMSMP